MKKLLLVLLLVLTSTLVAQTDTVKYPTSEEMGITPGMTDSAIIICCSDWITNNIKYDTVLYNMVVKSNYEFERWKHPKRKKKRFTINSYDFRRLYDSTQTPVVILRDRKAVCYGASLLLVSMLASYGIESREYTVEGATHSIVQINEDLYIDPTPPVGLEGYTNYCVLLSKDDVKTLY